MAESGFNPRAVSPAGALGIAQFMPSTARSYGLRDPFDPVAAIDAQAHLMSDLLRQFHSVPLALAAYNAGSGAVAACHCVPPYPETRAYVARILALAGGPGSARAPLEVRLVAVASGVAGLGFSTETSPTTSEAVRAVPVDVEDAGGRVAVDVHVDRARGAGVVDVLAVLERLDRLGELLPGELARRRGR